MRGKKRSPVKSSSFDSLLHRNVGELGLFIVLIVVLIVAALLVLTTQSTRIPMLAFSQTAKKVDNPVVLSQQSSPIPRQCAVYTRGEKQLTRCASCGNDICEEFEECVATTIYPDGKATTDCGKLHCLADCDRSSPSPP